MSDGGYHTLNGHIMPGHSRLTLNSSRKSALLAETVSRPAVLRVRFHQQCKTLFLSAFAFPANENRQARAPWR